MHSSDRSIAGATRGRPLRLSAVVFAAMVATVPAHAQELGVIGPVYAIAEPNLLEVILGNRRAAREDGEVARLQRESLVRVKQVVEDPTLV